MDRAKNGQNSSMPEYNTPPPDHPPDVDIPRCFRRYRLAVAVQQVYPSIADRPPDRHRSVCRIPRVIAVDHTTDRRLRRPIFVINNGAAAEMPIQVFTGFSLKRLPSQYQRMYRAALGGDIQNQWNMRRRDFQRGRLPIRKDFLKDILFPPTAIQTDGARRGSREGKSDVMVKSNAKLEYNAKVSSPF